MEKQQEGELGNHNIALSSSMSGHRSMHTETGNTSFSNHNLQRGSDLNPLGLFWSELEGNQNKPLSSTIPGSVENLIGNYDFARNASPFNLNQEQQFISGRDLPISNDSRSKNYRWDNDANTFPDNLVLDNMSRFEHGSNQLSLEQSMLFQQLQEEQLQRQLRQQSLLGHQNADLAGTFFDQVHEPIHQQPVNQQSMEDLELMLKLRFEQQLHLEQLQQQQLQQQQLQQQQLQRQRQLHQHQMQFLPQHLQCGESQLESQQIYLQNLLHQQLLEPGAGLSNVYPHSTQMMDQDILRQQLLNEFQKHSSNLSHESAMEQLIHANQGLNFQRQNKDLFNVLSHSKLRKMSREQEYLLELQLEQLQAQQLSASRNLTGIEDERHTGGIWSVDESGQFIRTAVSPHPNYPSRLSQSDFLQKSQGPSLVEHSSHSQRNYLLQDRIQRGLHPLDRPMHMRTGTSPPNLELINARARAQGLDAEEHLDQLHASGQIGQFHSNFHSHQRQISREFSGAHMDLTESHWSELARQLPADTIEAQLKQLQIKAEKQRGANMNISVENPNAWASYIENNENSEYELRDLLRQEMLHRSQHSLRLVDGVATSSYEQKDRSSLFYPRSDSENQYNLNRDKVGSNGVFPDASLLEQVRQYSNEQVMNTIDNKFESSNRFTLRPGSSTSFEQKQFLSNLDLFERGKRVNSISDASLQSIDFSNLKDGERGNMQHTDRSSRILSMVDVQESRVMQAGGGHEDKSFKQDFLDKTGAGLGFLNNEAEFDQADKEEVSNNMIYDGPKGVDSFLKHTSDPHDLPSARPSGTLQIAKGHNSATYGSSEEVKQEHGSSLISQSSEVLRSNKKDLKFRRTSSSIDADIIEPSFSDMLKSTKKSMPMPEPESMETSSVAKNSKKKGKKGRQIDPSLLGFKVHSNRILMGEIQRPDD